MANVIAEIRLAPGEVGYYDDYSRIYLTTSRPTAQIYAGTNTTQIRRSIRSGRLILISGSLNPPQAPVKEEPKAAAPKQVEKPVETKTEEKTETEPVEIVEAVEEIPVETPVEPVETPIEEPAEEPAKPKRRSRKKQAAE